VAEDDRMEEREWLACTDPRRLLLSLRDAGSDRKWRLFACACCRRIWPVIDEGSREIIEVAERYADGRATAGELEVTARASTAVPEGAVALAVCYAAYSGPHVWELDHVAQSAGYAVAAARDANPRQRRAAGEAEELAQALLLRDLFGNPFRSVALDPGWQTPAVLALAQAAYDNRILPAGTLEPERLAVLADALEESGCTDAAVLTHLRGPGPHVRGCWCVDLLLNKS
jgi:hypothetical protein